MAREISQSIVRPRGFDHRVISHADLEPPTCLTSRLWTLAHPDYSEQVVGLASPKVGEVLRLDLLRKSGEFPMSYEELDDPAATVYERI